MDISPDQLEEIRRRLGLTPDEFKRHSKHLTFILETTTIFPEIDMPYLITVQVENEDDKWMVEELLEQTDESGAFQDTVTVETAEVE